MTKQILMTVALVAALAAGGCGDEPEGAKRQASGSTTSVAPPTTSDVECRVERATIETAVEAYRVENGELPAALAGLAPEWLREPPSEEWRLRADGEDFAIDGPCPTSGRFTSTTTFGAESSPG